MTKEEIRLQVAISCIQGVLEAKHGVIGEIVPELAVKESLRIADEFVKLWFKESPLQKIDKDIISKIQKKLDDYIDSEEKRIADARETGRIYRLACDATLNTLVNIKNFINDILNKKQ